MSDALLTQIHSMLATLKTDIEAMTGTTANKIEGVMASLDDIAAHTLATQGIIAALLKAVPVDVNEVTEWLRERTRLVDKTGEGAQKAIDLAAHLISSSKSP